MSADAALKRLAEQVSLICSEHRKVTKRCAELEKEVAGLSEKLKRMGESEATGSQAGSDLLGSHVDKEIIKTKVEEMLADLADIG